MMYLAITITFFVRSLARSHANAPRKPRKELGGEEKRGEERRGGSRNRLKRRDEREIPLVMIMLIESVGWSVGRPLDQLGNLAP